MNLASTVFFLWYKLVGCSKMNWLLYSEEKVRQQIKEIGVAMVECIMFNMIELFPQELRVHFMGASLYDS